MTSNQQRADTLARALRAGIERDAQALRECCTDDVVVWTPSLSTTSLAELVEQLDQRDEAFSDVELEVAALDVGGEYACVEWTVEMTHTGTIRLGDQLTVEPSEIGVALHGVTVAEFAGERICAVRQYWDQLAGLEQLGVLGRDE